MKAERREITFEKLCRYCHYNKHGICQHWDSAELARNAKSCPIWKRLKVKEE